MEMAHQDVYKRQPPVPMTIVDPSSALAGADEGSTMVIGTGGGTVTIPAETIKKAPTEVVFTPESDVYKRQ